MSVDFEEFNLELARLDAIKAKRTVEDENERRALATELFQTFAARLNLMQWRDVVGKVISRHHRRGVLPVISDFKAALSGMYASGEISVRLCESCGGTRMVYIRVRNARINSEMDACRPCPRCQPHVEFHLKSELTLVPSDDTDSHLVRMAKALSDKAAHYALMTADLAGAQLYDEVKMILIEKACRYEESIAPKAPGSSAAA